MKDIRVVNFSPFEPAVGELFNVVVDGVTSPTYVTVEDDCSTSKSCETCPFWGHKYCEAELINCGRDYRADGKDVCFIKVETRSSENA